MLVVEDEPAIADAVVSRLRSEGFDVRSVGDGLAAVELCAEAVNTSARRAAAVRAEVCPPS